MPSVSVACPIAGSHGVALTRNNQEIVSDSSTGQWDSLVGLSTY
jgi:hypothetical protein